MENSPVRGPFVWGTPNPVREPFVWGRGFEEEVEEEAKIITNENQTI
jgi:hypothetical protein